MERMNPWERAKEALRRAESAGSYAAATVSSGNRRHTVGEWCEVHEGRAASSERQLDAVVAEARALLAEMERVECVEGGLYEDGFLGGKLDDHAIRPALLLLLPWKVRVRYKHLYETYTLTPEFMAEPKGCEHGANARTFEFCPKCGERVVDRRKGERRKGSHGIRDEARLCESRRSGRDRRQAP